MSRWPLLATILVLALAGTGLATAGTARYGGTLVVGISSGDLDTLDPTTSRSAQGGAEIFATFCEQLYAVGPKLETVPVLAAALPVASKDKLSYTVQLRQGIRFNDGTPFDAQAVVASVQRHMTLPGSGFTGFYVNVESVSAAGPYTVLYRLRSRDSALTFTTNAYIYSPTALASPDFATHPVCVGPFMFDHRVVGDHITVIKSPYYYDAKRVFLDKIVFKPVPDAAAAVAALQAGDIDVLDNVSTTARDAIAQSSGLRVLQSFQLGWTGMQVNFGNRSGVGNLPYANVGTPLATNAKLRQAFEEAIDRDALNRVVFGGEQQVTCTMIPPTDTLWYDATKVPCTRYDRGGAKRLVAESGVPNPTVRLLVMNTTDRLRLAQFIQAQEAAVGIDVVIDAFDNATVIALRGAGKFDVYLGGFTPGGVDPISTIHLATADPRNYSGYSNPRLDLILANGLKASDPKARAVLYRAAQQLILTERPYIALYNPSVLAAYRSSVSGVRLTPAAVVLVANAQLR